MSLPTCLTGAAAPLETTSWVLQLQLRHEELPGSSGLARSATGREPSSASVPESGRPLRPSIRRRILRGPQLDGRPSWELQALTLVASLDQGQDKLKEILALRVRLQMERRIRELALFNLGIDSKLRGCDLVALKVRDVRHCDPVGSRAILMQHKTLRPVQFEITAATRAAVQAWIKRVGLKTDDFLFPSRIDQSPHLCT